MGDDRQDRRACAAVLLLAFAARLTIVATFTYRAHLDETFQYLEAGHRLAFGSGVTTWEYLDGIRNWLLPGAIAGVMRLVAAVDPNPAAYIFVLRLLCVFASLSVPYAGYRLGSRAGGTVGGVMAGLMCAFSSQALYYAPVIMTEPLATDAILLAITLGETGAVRPRRCLLIGALFGLACALRFQYGPIIAAIALWQYARDWRALSWVVCGGAVVVVAVLGGLDAATWGTPFQSVWMNYLRNVPQGFSSAIGSEDWTYYLIYYVVSWDAATPVILALAILGARRAPVLIMAVIVTIGLHSVIPHKEPRFILLATTALPILIALGLINMSERLPKRWSHPSWRVGAALVLAGIIAWGTETHASGLSAWHRDRSMFWAMAAARDVPNACGLAFRSVGVYWTGGYSYWHRDVPLYFEAWDAAHEIPGSNLRLDIDSELRGHRVPQFSAADLPAHADKFNVMIGRPGDGFPGFTTQACFGVDAPFDRSFCVFARPGGCD